MINKPTSWAFDPDSIDPAWQWFFADASGVCWPMWENTGTTLNDIDDLNVDATFAASTEDPAWTADALGVAVLFDDDDYASVAGPTGLGTIIGQGPFTLYAVVRPDTVGTRGVVIGDWDGSGNDNAIFLERTAGDIWRAGVNTNTSGFEVTSSTSASADTLAVIVLRWDGSELSLWVNGVEEDTQATTGTLNAGVDTNIGRAAFGGSFGGSYFDGTILMLGIQDDDWTDQHIEDWSADPFKVLEEDAGGGDPNGAAVDYYNLLMNR